ncbi:Precorrin-3B C(17)-methyltransferase [Leptospira santarosai]|uniref:Precorrin-3B C(17)-methyltransferase n=1 Tax=Leptospira santarosai TaxID=28183 RepID=A0A2P1QX80_9LEPT|nr:Precorrin-3B C(17)-methyltransferase [Leptospira santarosai]
MTNSTAAVGDPLLYITKNESVFPLYQFDVIFVSERLLTYVRNQSEQVFLNGQEYTDISWLGAVPSEVWNLVRGAILKC